MFTGAALTTEKTLKQPKCPSTEECINIWCVYIYICIYAMGYYSVIIKNEMSFAATQLDLEIIILSEVSQTKKYRMISFTCEI